MIALLDHQRMTVRRLDPRAPLTMSATARSFSRRHGITVRPRRGAVYARNLRHDSLFANAVPTRRAPSQQPTPDRRGRHRRQLLVVHAVVEYDDMMGTVARPSSFSHRATALRKDADLFPLWQAQAHRGKPDSHADASSGAVSDQSLLVQRKKAL